VAAGTWGSSFCRGLSLQRNKTQVYGMLWNSKIINPLPTLTYQNVLDLNVACRAKRTQTYRHVRTFKFPLKETQPSCPCSRDLNWTGKGLKIIKIKLLSLGWRSVTRCFSGKCMSLVTPNLCLRTTFLKSTCCPNTVLLSFISPAFKCMVWKYESRIIYDKIIHVI
jgi:hypothetical protein